ncbi:MAG TPA: alpha/beta hydrolase [Candidatus Acidoferrum sp.]|nr:alpha/beta hydrolase [Candidatus Acidoferrum sp.]
MYVRVNGTRLFFDIVGAKLGVVGDKLREKPTLIALHGGPGLDHLVLRSFFDRFSDIAQVVYVDLRGNGRSVGSLPASWTLAQWGDDVRAFCDQLGIDRPIVLGNSFGGCVAQSYATRHPDHPAGLVLSSTSARMVLSDLLDRVERAGSGEARAAAEKVFTIGDEESYCDFDRLLAPLFMSKSAFQNMWAIHTIRRYEVSAHFQRAPDGEFHHMDFRADLRKVLCPTLVLSGGPGDVITPPEGAQEISDALPRDLVRFECLAHCRHGVFRDDPEMTDRIIRSFIAEVEVREGARRSPE